MNEENIKSEDYIDLPPLKKITIQFLTFIFSTLDLFIQVLKNGKLLLLAGLISGLGVGFAYYSSRPVYYEVSMIAESSDLYKKTVSEMIKSLNELIASGSYPKLSDELGISESHSKSISFIDLTNLNNDPIEKDTSTKFNQPFKILARISNPELTDTFQNAITRYMNGKRRQWRQRATASRAPDRRSGSAGGRPGGAKLCEACAPSRGARRRR